MDTSGCSTLEQLRAKFHVLGLHYAGHFDVAEQDARVKALQTQCYLEPFVNKCAAELDFEMGMLAKHTTGIRFPPGLSGQHEQSARVFAVRLFRDIVSAEGRSAEDDV